jgi:hypothetical protein
MQTWRGAPEGENEAEGQTSREVEMDRMSTLTGPSQEKSRARVDGVCTELLVKGYR